MPRQPESEAVLSTGGRLHPLPFWKGRGLGSGLRPLQPGEGQVGQKNTSLSKEGRGGSKNLTGWIEDYMTTQESLRRDVGKITSPCRSGYVGT